YELKQPGDFFISLTGKTAVAGDVLVIDGTFTSTTTDAVIVFNNSGLKYNGSAWETYVPATVFTITEIAPAGGCTTSVVYAYPTDESQKPTVNSWDHAFTFQAGTGKGIKLNDEELIAYELKQPGDFYIGLTGKTAVAGDILVLDGTFRNDALNTEIVFNDSMLKYNGSAWETYVPTYYTTHNIGALVLHGNSITGGAKGNNNELYLQRADGNALPITSWDVAFVAENEENFKINGESAELLACKSTGDGFYWNFNNLSAGDVVTISGNFICEAQTTKYVIEESKFTWNGSAWEKYVDYITYELGGVVAIVDGSASNGYLQFADGVTLPVSSWDHAFMLFSGNGITVDGNPIDMTNNVKSVGNKLYVTLTPTSASENSILSIGGTFYNANLAVKYVIEESSFKWTGTEWKVFVPGTVELGEVALYSTSTITSNATSFYFTKSQNSLTSAARNKIFYPVLGTGVLINGNAVEDVSFKQTSTTYFTLTLSGVNVGDILTIGGTFATTGTTIYAYEFIDTQYQWDGSAWAKYVPPVEEMPTYEVGKVLATRDSNASQLYLAKADGTTFEVKGDWTLKLTFEEGSGVGITFNDTQIDMGDIKIPNDIFVGLGKTASKGDKVVIAGAFFSEELNVKYIVEESTFFWSGAAWIDVMYKDEDLVKYDVVSLSDLGLGLTLDIPGGAVVNRTDSFYNQSVGNVMGSVKFRFGYNSTDSNAGAIDIRLRGTAWEGVHFNISWSQIFYDGNSFTFSNNTDYVIELGAIDLLDGTGTWVYVSVDGVFVISKKVDLSATSFNTNRVSLHVNDEVAKTTLSDVDHVAVTYVSTSGTFVDYAKKNEAYSLVSNRAYNTFIGWAVGNTLYKEGDEITVSENITVNAVEVDFAMKDGAAIRLSSVASVAGIRFTSLVKESDVNALIGNYGIASVSYGTIIMPFDYLEVGQAPNLEDTFKNILNLPSTYSEVEDGYVIFRGAMTNILENNYDRFFAGRGYMQITFEGGDVWTVYTPFSYDDNVRSIRYVAQKFVNDENADVKYNELDDKTKEVVDTYAATNRIHLIDYAEYVENSFEITAWYHPYLDPANAYDNVTNEEAAQAMKDAGIKTVILDGENFLDLTTPGNTIKTRQIIEFFWSQGLQTIAYGSNLVDNGGYPDFSDCEGFVGFLVYDEPTPDEIDNIASFVDSFKSVYAGTDVTFMANLLPAYAETFQNGGGNWYNKVVDIDEAAYKQYLKDYCDKVLSKVSGEKWLSMDSYPIFNDYSLHATFLFDLAMTKYYSLYAGATSHAVLQASGWEEDGHGEKNRMPTEAEMRMQAYTAMAFGIDSISWWSYANKSGDSQSNPTDNADYYNRFANVNNELNKIGAIYSAFDWKGVILGAGSNNGGWNNSDQDYNAFSYVKGQIGDYELSASDTKYLASVATNQTNWNYIMGVMEDVAGNEAYVLCNYNDHSTDRAQTITITFGLDVSEVIIYRGGVKTTQSVSGQTLTINLATGEGVIIIPSALA
ncbi:MAG: hypothetical protein IKA99_08105, partial [Clostridia bacterium]|nr:hypothetical protein [Clostridia bacterium]